MPLVSRGIHRHQYDAGFANDSALWPHKAEGWRVVRGQAFVRKIDAGAGASDRGWTAMRSSGVGGVGSAAAGLDKIRAGLPVAVQLYNGAGLFASGLAEDNSPKGLDALLERDGSRMWRTPSVTRAPADWDLTPPTAAYCSSSDFRQTNNNTAAGAKGIKNLWRPARLGLTALCARIAIG